MGRFAVRFGPFRVVKRPILHCEMGRLQYTVNHDIMEANYRLISNHAIIAVMTAHAVY